jgi:hypothetical protein
MVAMNQGGSLAGKVAFVTGAASGIGRAAALAFARAGASVVVADLAEQANQETASLIEKAGGRAVAVRCDVTRSQDVRAALQQAVEVFGRLDVAFNNAGAEQAVKPAAETTEQEWDRIIAINLRGVFLCLKYEIPLMLRQGGGAIVNTSSGAGVKGFGGGVAYAASKCRLLAAIATGGGGADREHRRACERGEPESGQLGAGHSDHVTVPSGWSRCPPPAACTAGRSPWRHGPPKTFVNGRVAGGSLTLRLLDY